MKLKNFLATAAVAIGLAATSAEAIDVGPADYTIVPSGTMVSMLYWQHLSSDELRLNGGKVPGSKLKGDVGVARGLYYFNLGSLPAAVQVVTPFATLDADIGGAKQNTSDGLGDTTVGLTVWPVQPSNPETGTTLGVSMFATLPTGSYDTGKLGISEGTTSFTPQVGLIQGLGGGFYLDAAFDVSIALDHKEGGVTYKREPIWQLQAMLRKQFNPTTSLAIGYSGLRGGDQSIGGVKTGL